MYISTSVIRNNINGLKNKLLIKQKHLNEFNCTLIGHGRMGIILINIIITQEILLGT